MPKVTFPPERHPILRTVLTRLASRVHFSAAKPMFQNSFVSTRRIHRRTLLLSTLSACFVVPRSCPAMTDSEAWKVLGNSPWVRRTKVHLFETISFGSGGIWAETSGGWPTVKPSGRSQKVTVEWTSAPQVRQARAALGRSLPSRLTKGYYVLSVLNAPPELLKGQSFLSCAGRSDLVGHTEPWADEKRLACSCYFAVERAFGQSDVVVFQILRGSQRTTLLNVGFALRAMAERTSTGVLTLSLARTLSGAAVLASARNQQLQSGGRLVQGQPNQIAQLNEGLSRVVHTNEESLLL